MATGNKTSQSNPSTKIPYLPSSTGKPSGSGRDNNPPENKESNPSVAINDLVGVHTWSLRNPAYSCFFSQESPPRYLTERFFR